MRRIVVIGTSGSGKSTFAANLATRLSLPHIELDELYWGPNWTMHSDFVARVIEAVRQECWVTAGNYSGVREIVWGAADTIVLLDYPMRLVFMQCLKRTIHRAWSRTHLWSGNYETFRKSFLDKDSILLWVIQTWRVNRRRLPKALAEWGLRGKRTVHLRSPRASRLFFAGV